VSFACRRDPLGWQEVPSTDYAGRSAIRSRLSAIIDDNGHRLIGGCHLSLPPFPDAKPNAMPHPSPRQASITVRSLDHAAAVSLLDDGGLLVTHPPDSHYITSGPL